MPILIYTRNRYSAAVLGWLTVVLPVAAQTSPGSVVYRCPNNVYTSDRELSAQQAQERGCKPIDNLPVTVVPATKPRPNTPPAGAAASPASRPADARVDPSEQRARDTDRRRILGDELRMEEERLVLLRKDFNNGEPERRGDERNFQKYQERVAEMKAAVGRKESDIAAIKRELSKIVP